MIWHIWPADRHRHLVAAMAAAVLVLPACGGSEDATVEVAAAAAPAGELVVTDAWIRPAPAGSATTALYMTISNEGDDIDVLRSASVEGCAMTELHMTTMEDGVMSMSPLPDGITMTPEASIVLGPGGIHIMCIGVETGFEDGGDASVELQFDDAGSVTANAQVRRDE